MGKDTESTSSETTPTSPKKSVDDKKKKVSEEEKKKKHDDDDSSSEKGESTEKSEEELKKEDAEFEIKVSEVLDTHTYGSVTLREFANIDCEGCLVVEGFPSEGLTCLLCANFFVENLKLPLIGDIVSRSFPAIAFIDGRIPSHACRIYGDKRMVVFVSGFKLTPEISNDVVDAIYDFSNRHKATTILTVEGMPEEPKIPKNIRTEEELYAQMARMVEETYGPEGSDGKQAISFITNNQNTYKKLLTAEHSPIRNAVVGGVTGGILAESMVKKIPVVCLLSKYNPILPDARAALAIVNTVNNLYSDTISLDAKPLLKEMAEMEKKIKKAASKAMTVRTPGTVPSTMYM